jgi:hypothetical protein
VYRAGGRTSQPQLNGCHTLRSRSGESTARRLYSLPSGSLEACRSEDFWASHGARTEDFHRRSDKCQPRIPDTQVVWTGPKVEGSFLRATREVVRELLRGARAELLVVGYWIAARDDGEGIIEELIASLADGVIRGVTVSVVMDERVRPDGRDNGRILKSIWPIAVTLPKLLTWRLPAAEELRPKVGDGMKG